jgi:hypothetical protein
MCHDAMIPINLFLGLSSTRSYDDGYLDLRESIPVGLAWLLRLEAGGQGALI